MDAHRQPALGPDREPRRRGHRAAPAGPAAHHDAVRLQRHLRHRHRLGLRAVGRQRRGDGGREEGWPSSCPAS
ncbi:hypothetical protein G5V59_05780 [Nocardioides sp. W3-2-3]|uniref:hypothetical protein n=1 Tax=Nocardioides convexus TaxID=2712224 RepID=UPI002418A319|nr:hypothetical protein [Nocardioides convexus]NGZ99927.1 hypothetical protein [Nocardioides convexus]